MHDGGNCATMDYGFGSANCRSNNIVDLLSSRERMGVVRGQRVSHRLLDRISVSSAWSVMLVSMQCDCVVLTVVFSLAFGHR
mmetsp:Transcript_60760/g.72147  ORF Transcript_60760/g.72147 Transcript_60760/m.72147 type:complete len:82 (-) Transcript_60760:238-483(-)